MADGSDPLTYRELEERSLALARGLMGLGLRPGDRVATVLANRTDAFVAMWAVQRAGLAWAPVNWHLSPEEAAYIVADSQARALLASSALRLLAEQAHAAAPAVRWRILVDGEAEGWERAGELRARDAGDAAPDQVEGQWMFYSSGTTGRPKGILRTTTPAPYGSGTAIDALLGSHYGFGPDTVYLCPAPLYHAAPAGWSMGTQRRGGTVVLMDAFNPRGVLAAIERHRITHAQFVPTMFVRMLKLPAEERTGHDLSSLRMAVHGAAPCPPEVKHAMLAWWGPVLHEYYAGSEGTGFVAIGPKEWLAHPGSVGRPLRGPVHVLDEEGRPLPAGADGLVWFEGADPFDYHGDPDKTRQAFNSQGWTTLGDIGHLDADGYLYLTDRATDVILSGGVNVYPQEIERVLLQHPAVLDAGVVGAPDPDLGERPAAFVELVPGTAAGAELADELRAYVRGHLAGIKCPRSVTVVEALPRLPTGKLLRRRLRQLLPAGADEATP